MIVECLIEDPRWRAAGASRALAAELGLGRVPLGYCLLGCDDARIAALNADHRGKARPTNVLSWPSAERGAAVPGGQPIPPAPDPTGEAVELGDVALAYETCAKTHPDSAHAAWLAMANIKLSVGDVVGAARLFERVTKTGAMGETLALAQLGATVTHERLGDYQAVLAELSHSDLSPELQGRRRDRVVERESR